MIDDIKRVAGPFTTAGQTQLPFSFTIFELTDVYVATATSDLESATNLVLGSDYTVTMNADQTATPGGCVTLTSAIAEGQVVVIGSAIPYNQTTQLTNFSRFPPEIINKALDRIVVQIQQIVEKLGRVLSVPVTSSMTPDDLIEMLLRAQQDAEQYSKSAGEYAEQAKNVAEELTSSKDGLIAQMNQAAEDRKAAIRYEGDLQVDRVIAAADTTLWRSGIACQECTWTVTEAVSADTEITIPNGLQYMVGRHHLRVSWNGLMLYPGENWDEVGDVDAMSSKIKVHFGLSVGDVMDAWVASLGAGSVTEAIEAANAATDAVAELSRKVVYKDAESAS